MVHYRISATIDDEPLPPQEVVLEDLAAARDMAAKAAGDLMRDPETGLWTHGDLSFDISNNGGLLLFSLRVVVATAPAIIAGRHR